MSNYNWADDHARQNRLPRDWHRRRQGTLKRAGYQCQAVSPSTGARCTEPATQCDHIVAGDNHDYSNLQALCAWHHARKTAGEGAEGRRKAQADRPSTKRPTPRHPGEL